MKFEEFIGQIQNLAQLGSEGDAANATRAVLVTLGERLKGGEPLNVAAELPKAIKEYLTESTGSGEGEDFSADEFVRRVANREGINETEALVHAQAAFQVLQRAISEGEWRDMRAQLPRGYSKLFKEVKPPAASRKQQSKEQSITARKQVAKVPQAQAQQQAQQDQASASWSHTDTGANWQETNSETF